MKTEIEILEEPRRPLSMHPQKFAMWLFIVTVVMVFAGITSAYIVKQGEGNWKIIDMPISMWVTTGVIILSSITMHWTYLSAKADNLELVKVGMGLTTFLGLVFLGGQWYVWTQLVAQEVFLVGNPAGSFLYIFTGLHAAHLISGIIFLIIVLISTFKYKVHSKNMVRLDMCTTYWHFLGGLWVYLFIFLLLNH